MKSLKTSINLKEELLSRFQFFCKRNDFNSAQALKYMVVSVLSSDQKELLTVDEISSHGHFSRTCEVNNDLSLDKSNSSYDALREFSKIFVGAIKNRVFPERINKEIKSHWGPIIESKLSANELAEAYNQYVSEQQSKESIPAHPNSWIAGHGWKNKSETMSDEIRGNYEF
jgi:hypothetical protein